MALGRLAYVSIFFAHLVLFILDVAAFNRIDWIVVRTPGLSLDYGLTEECDPTTGKCHRFPPPGECQSRPDVSTSSSLCFQWHTAAYLFYLSIVIGILLLFSLLAILVGGRSKRESGWKVVVGLQMAFVALQSIGLALVANQMGQGGRDVTRGNDNFKRFGSDAHFGWAFIIAVVETSGTLLVSIGMGILANLHPPEYQRIA